MSINQLELNFNVKYPGRFFDGIKIKISTFLLIFVLAVTAILIGIYFISWDYGRVITQWSIIIGIILVGIGVVGAFCSPFIGLFTGFNRGFKGSMKIEFIKDGTTSKWQFSLKCEKKSGIFTDSGEVNTINLKGKVAVLSTLNGKDYYIPQKAIGGGDWQRLLEIEKEVREYRIEETKKRMQRK